MSSSSILKRAFALACYGFCALTLLYSLVMIGVYDTQANMSVFTVLLFYPFCFSIALANEFLKKGKISGFVGAIVRYVIFLVAAGLFICLPHKEAISGTAALILFFLFTVVYILITLILSLFFTSKKKSEEYVNVYKNENRK